MAFPPARAFADRCLDACAETGTRLWARVSGQSLGVRLGMEAPDFALNDLSGNPVVLSNLQGKVVLLNFWATWCPPCQVEIPWFMEFQERYRDGGLVVLGVSMDEEGPSVVKPFADKVGMNYPVMLGTAQVAKAYGGVDTLPLTLMMDRSGQVKVMHIGLASRETYQEEIEELLR